MHFLSLGYDIVLRLYKNGGFYNGSMTKRCLHLSVHHLTDVPHDAFVSQSRLKKTEVMDFFNIWFFENKDKAYYTKLPGKKLIVYNCQILREQLRSAMKSV
jgi:hypothetical protein